MIKKISAFLLIAAMLLSLSACSLLGFFAARTEPNYPEVENPNSFVSGNFNGALNPSQQHIIIQNGQNGITILTPDQIKPQETEPQETESFFQGSISMQETWYYFYPFDESNGRLGRIDFYDDNAFTLTTYYYMRHLDYDDVFWYCPGTETSGVDTPSWQGTYAWNGSELQLFVENYVRTFWEQPNDWSPPEPVGEELVPVNKMVNMQVTEDAGAYYRMNCDPLPIMSEFDCAPAGEYILFFNESDINRLFP